MQSLILVCLLVACGPVWQRVAPQQGAKVPDLGGVVADYSQGEAVVRAAGAAQETPGALRHQHEMEGQGDLGVRLAGFLALLGAFLGN
jgi:hypothetical protein